MSETRIEWTDATWNPVAGYSVLTTGCTNCYAMAMAKRLEAMGVEKYAGLTRRSGKRCLAHRMRNLAAKAPVDIWPEFRARATAAY